MAESGSANPKAIGEKLRSARQSRQMSLRDLAARAEISASMLSQVETGKASPSVRSLYNIATALGVPVDYFFPDPADEDPFAVGWNQGGPELTPSDMREALAQRLAGPGSPDPKSLAPAASPLVHAASRPTIELKGGVGWSRLTALPESSAEFLEISYAPGATSGVNLSHHAGREFGLVLEGELVVDLGFESYTLAAGDSIVFESSTPHRLTNTGGVPMRAVWVVWNES